MEEENEDTIECLEKKQLYIISDAVYSNLLKKLIVTFKAFFF